ncbi:MAG: ABC transporter substrate-binding protein [Nitrospirae bacterium]|nr:ABC transporter substrate-binding protein [Nitrospirota bacterium]MBF0535981.1 ABC transporter substrate-binding protein [Nitrospirota bacterium]MBF0617898.1 ABC transporter substrate-binding protein [Nitrospirota bacterium]
MKRTFVLITVLIFISLLNSCKTYFEKTEKRGVKAEKLSGNIVIGVVRSSTQTDDMVDGIMLAVEEFNAKGGFKGRKMRYIEREDNGKPDNAIEIAREFANNEDVIAVIGHLNTDVAIAASVVYEYNGVVFITPRATNPLLTRHGFGYVFRNRTSDGYSALWLAKYMYDMGYKDVVVVDDNSAYGTGLAISFQTYATDFGLNVEKGFAYYKGYTDYRYIIENIKGQGKFDAVFIAGTAPDAAVFIQQAREMGLTAPFVGGNGIHSPLLWTIAGKAAEGVVTSTEFNHEDNNTITREFIRHFEAKYKRQPHEMAALGYDDVELIIYAFTKGGTTTPEVIASNIRFIEGWESVLGYYDMKENGDIGDKRIYFEKLRNGEFTLLNYDKDETYEGIKKFFDEHLKDIHKEVQK